MSLFSSLSPKKWIFPALLLTTFSATPEVFIMSPGLHVTPPRQCSSSSRKSESKEPGCEEIDQADPAAPYWRAMERVNPSTYVLKISGQTSGSPTENSLLRNMRIALWRDRSWSGKVDHSRLQDFQVWLEQRMGLLFDAKSRCYGGLYN